MKSKGSAIERVVENYLIANGLQLIQRNFLCRRGEIDLIMKDQNEIVFIEVRYRKSIRHGTPEETIAPSKVRKLILTAKIYLQNNTLWESPCRFDIVGVTPSKDHSLAINWIRDAFTT